MPKHTISYLNLAILFGLAIYSFYLLLFLCQYTFDITDEGFYLAAIDYADKYTNNSSNFGIVLQPIWNFLGKDIVLFRQLNALCIVSLAIIMFYLLLNYKTEQRSFHKKIQTLLYATIFSISSLAFYSVFLPTPNYNSINFIAIELAVIAYTIADASSLKKSILSAIIIGFSGWLAFMGKPTSAAGLAVIALFFHTIFFLSNKQKKHVAISFLVSGLTAVTLVWITAHIASGSLINFLNELRTSFELNRVFLGSDWATTSSLLWKGSFRTVHDKSTIFIFLFSLVTLLILILDHQHSIKNNKLFLFLAKTLNLVLMFFMLKIVFSVLFFGQANPNIILTLSEKIAIVWLPVIIISIVVYGLEPYKEKRLSDLYLPLLLICAPYIYAIGTGNSYLVPISLAPLFSFAIFAYVSRHKLNHSSIQCVAVFALLIGALSLPVGGKKGYRYPEVSFKTDTPIAIERLKGLKLNSKYNDYLTSLNQIARNAGFHDNTPIIDLTGASPGVIYTVGGEPFATAWMSGGYIGSTELAIEKIKRASIDDFNRAWVLHEDWSGDWKRGVNPDILNQFGKNLETDYIKVGSVKTVRGFGGRNKSETIQTLYKPK